MTLVGSKIYDELPDVYIILQAQSAKLIGDAIQQNPAFLTLRKIEVRLEVTYSSLCNAWFDYLLWGFFNHRSAVLHAGCS